MVDYLEGGRIPRAKYPLVTLDQFALEDDILYLCKQKVDGTILYLLVVPNELCVYGEPNTQEVDMCVAAPERYSKFYE